MAADILKPAQRSELMSRIRGTDTKPEKTVRSLLHQMGFRFRLHDRQLPGVPDIVLPRFRSAILVHGCFWHRHKGCRYAYLPKSRVAFWMEKFEGNVKRDRRNLVALRRMGWRVLVIWECETENMATTRRRLEKFLRGQVTVVRGQERSEAVSKMASNFDSIGVQDRRGSEEPARVAEKARVPGTAKG